MTLDKMTIDHLEKIVTDVLREGNFEIIEYPNLYKDPITYPRYYEFINLLLTKIKEDYD